MHMKQEWQVLTPLYQKIHTEAQPPPRTQVELIRLQILQQVELQVEQQVQQQVWRRVRDRVVRPVSAGEHDVQVQQRVREQVEQQVQQRVREQVYRRSQGPVWWGGEWPVKQELENHKEGTL